MDSTIITHSSLLCHSSWQKYIKLNSMAAHMQVLNLLGRIWQFEASHHAILEDPGWIVLCGYF